MYNSPRWRSWLITPLNVLCKVYNTITYFQWDNLWAEIPDLLQSVELVISIDCKRIWCRLCSLNMPCWYISAVWNPPDADASCTRPCCRSSDMHFIKDNDPNWILLIGAFVLRVASYRRSCCDLFLVSSFAYLLQMELNTERIRSRRNDTILSDRNCCSAFWDDAWVFGESMTRCGNYLLLSFFFSRFFRWCTNSYPDRLYLFDKDKCQKQKLC